MEKRILLIDDDVELCHLLERSARWAGFALDAVHNGREGCLLAERGEYVLIILDVMLPEMDGFEVLARIRAQSTVPILMLTARDTDGDKISGLLGGADDYLTKPIGTSELLARIRTALRHSNRLNTASPLYKRPFHAKGLTIDFEKHLVSVDGRDVHLTQIEFKMITVFCA